MAKVEAERFFGNKGIIIMIRDGNKFTSAIFKDKKNADKFNRNNPSDVKKLLQLAKKTKFPKGIDEDTDVGHEDDEPNMLKSTALEIMEYGKKLMDKLDKYDDMDGEVDFPNWWQSKLTLAKDYVQKAYHYLDSEEKTSETIDRSFRYDGYEDDEGPVDEAFLVAYGKREGNKSIKPAFAAYADKKMAQKFMADMKKDGYKVMMTQKKIRGIDESASKLAMGIAGFTGTRGVAVDDFIQKNKIDAKKLFNFVKKGNLKDRMAFVAAIAGRPNNKMFKMITKQFGEGKLSENEMTHITTKDTSKQKLLKLARILPALGLKNKVDYKLSSNGKILAINTKKIGLNQKKYFKKKLGIDLVVKEDKNQIIQLKKKVGKKEIKFYDALSKLEKKMGKKKYRDFLVKSLKDFKVNGNHYDYRTNAAAEEKLFQLAK